ncbi:MAG: hypothetical protein QMD46_09590 [Methanomicrobiales archaeon]|nr:hypothetical protein [Methanomicrobiales archaeon]MDI6877227.1 hypothetical protein [Methanomicrobiales archaeon]
MDEIEFLEIVAGLQQVEENCLIGSPLTEFEVIPVDGRFGPVFLGDIVPGTPGGQDVEDPIDELAGIPPGPTDVRFLGREMLPDNFPKIIVDFPKCHARGSGSSRVL